MMKQKLLAGISLFLLLSCAHPQSSSNTIPAGNPVKRTGKEAVATFAEGCFWHAEIVFQSLAGVRDAVSGYCGGTDASPDYEKVSTGNTGHAESVQVYYDPAVISYETLVKAFFASMNPTQVNGQGNDLGTEYRSVAFYRNDQEKKIIESEIKRINDSHTYNSPVVTEVKSFQHFYPAEEYHQEYIAHHPENPYVQHVSIPEYKHFRETFPGKFKQ